MSDPLLPYYNRELGFLREMGQEFAAAHPQVASRLRLDPEMAEDPHVSRLVEAFAYLNARTRHKLDDDFPELTEALLGVLYPHYLAPIPSCAIAQLHLDPSQKDQDQGKHLPRGTAVESNIGTGEPLRFRTCYDVSMWPIEMELVRYSGIPFQAPETPISRSAVSALTIRFKCRSPQLRFSDLPLEKLTLYLNGQRAHALLLYEFLLNHSLGVIVANSHDDKQPIVLPPDALCPRGFSAEDALLRYPARSFTGYRVLTEYFSFLQKFLFVDLQSLSGRTLSQVGNTLELYALFDRYEEDLERHIETDSLQLGCTPIVNSFERRAEPIRVSHRQYEYRVVPDSRRPEYYEVASVEKVSSLDERGEEQEYAPFFSVKHGFAEDSSRFWYASRRPAGLRKGETSAATEVYLSLVDLNMQPVGRAREVLDLELTCTNRDVPREAASSPADLALQLSEGTALVRVKALTRPTTSLRPPSRHGALWRLISHLNLNYLTLAESPQGAEAIREILKLYDYQESDQTKRWIEGLTRVDARRVVGRVPGHLTPGFCRGVELTCTFAEQNFVGGGLYLFASVLEHFFGLYCSINSFAQMVGRTDRKEAPFAKWSARAGEHKLV